jgi:hypothetical protein
LRAMKNGIYAILAVVIGVMLIGILPGQLSNLVALPTVQRTPLQSGAPPESKSNTTITGLVTSDNVYSNSNNTATTRAQTSPYADLGYYSLWGVGLIAAIAVYFVSRKILG